MVVLHQLPAHQRKPDGVVEIQDVGEADIAITGRIQLADVVDAETGLESRPGPGPQTVADHFLHTVVAVIGSDRLVDQVAAQLTDIPQRGRPVTAHVAPELAGAELAPNREPRGPTDRRAPAHAQACGVVQRQRAIHDIVGLHVQGDQAEAGGRAHPATMAKHPGLGQPSGA